MIETVPQSFSRIDFTSRAKLLHYQYNPRKLKNANKAKHGGDDDDDDDNDQEEDGKRQARNPDAGNTTMVKFGDPVPLSHPLGQFPPRWTNYKPTYRGFKLNQRIKQLFDILPGIMFTFPLLYFD